MTPLTRTAVSAAVAAVLTAWTMIDLPSVNWGTSAAIWGVLTAVITGGWAVIDAETRGES